MRRRVSWRSVGLASRGLAPSHAPSADEGGAVQATAPEANVEVTRELEDRLQAVLYRLLHPRP